MSTFGNYVEIREAYQHSWAFRIPDANQRVGGTTHQATQRDGNAVEFVNWLFGKSLMDRTGKDHIVFRLRKDDGHEMYVEYWTGHRIIFGTEFTPRMSAASTQPQEG